MKVIHDQETVAALADSASFTGRVWRTTYIDAPDGGGLSGLRFSYEPGARSHWHVHEQEQAIIAVHGHGLVAWEGASPVRLAAGDWWHVEPGVPHWHGASPDTPFAHLAVNAGGSITWLHEVSEEDYRATPSA